MSNGRRRPAPSTDWKAPVELLRSSPRPIRLTIAGQMAAGAAVVLAAGACLGGAWVYVRATRDAARLMRLRSEGVSVPAKVVGLGRTRGDHPQPVVSYQYEAAGEVRSGRATLGSNDQRAFAIGADVRVRFLPSEPGTSWLPGHEPRGVPLWLVPIVPACLTLGALTIAYVIRRQRALLAEGRAARAQVTSTRRMRTGEGHTSYRIEYEFRVLSGATRTGSYEKKTKEPPPIGSTLTVLYDPDEPARNARYPLLLARVGTL